MRISVVGGGAITDGQTDLAAAVGRIVGQRGHVLVCGGLGGTMAAACRGAKAAGGETVGILPGEDRDAANEHVDTAIATGLGHARNALVVLNGDGVVALPGAWGTLTEIGFAGVYDRPVVGIETHELPEVPQVETPVEAIDHLESTGDG